MASLLAALTGRELVHGADEAAVDALATSSGGASLCVLQTWDRMDAAALDRWARRAREGALGLICADDAAGLSRAIAKIVAAHREVGIAHPFRCVVEGASFSSENTSDALQVLDGADLDPDALARQVRDRHRFLAIKGHGGNIDVTLNVGAVLCGLTEDAPARGRGPHFCQSAGHCSREQIGQKLRVPVDRINADLLFVVTCGGIAASDGIYSADLSLARGALGALATSYLSTTKVTATPDWIPAFYGATALSGVPLGEATRRLSALHVGLTGSTPTFVLLGDPALRLAAPRPAEACIDISGDEARRVVHLRDWSAHAVDIELSALMPTLAAGYLAGDTDLVLDLRVLGPGENGAQELADAFTGEVLARVYADGRDLRCAVFSTASLEGRTVELAVKASPHTTRRLRQEILAFGRGKQLLQWMGAIHQTSRSRRLDAGRVDHFDEALRTLLEGVSKGAELLKSAFDIPAAANQLQRPYGSRAAMLAGAHSLASKAIVKALDTFPKWGMRFYFAETYGAAFKSVGRRDGCVCPNCRTASEEVIVEAVERPDMRRAHLYCPRCSIVQDAPADMPTLRILCPDEVPRGRAIVVGIEQMGDLPPGRPLIASLAIEGRIPWVDARCEPGHVVIGPGAAASVKRAFTLEIPKASAPGTYYLVLIYFVGSEVAVATRPIRVLP
ncbi:hypothetical protein [Roseateles sp.]|uniref:hypothetical protein n=1 Tax=Roseateles sp. TaxID=1971397 RepID=UPI003D0DD9E6